MGASSPKALATINDMLVHLIYCKSNACNGVGLPPHYHVNYLQFLNFIWAMAWVFSFGVLIWQQVYMILLQSRLILLPCLQQH
jgi:hypothetical protein